MFSIKAKFPLLCHIPNSQQIDIFLNLTAGMMDFGQISESLSDMDVQ